MIQAKMSTKLYCLVGFMSVCMVLVAGIGIYVGKVTGEAFFGVYNNRIIPLEQLKVISDMYAVNIVDTSHKVRDGALSWGDGRKNLAEAQKKVMEKWKAYVVSNHTPDEKKLVDEVTTLMKKVDESVAKLTTILASENKEALAKFAATELYPTVDPLTDKLSSLVSLQLTIAKQDFDKTEVFYGQGKIVSALLIIAGILSSVIIAVITIKGIHALLGGEPTYVTKIAQAVAQGDLSVHVDVDERRHQNSALHAMKMMTNSLRTVITQSVNISESIAAASSQLNGTSEHIATGAEEVAAQTGTVATASEEMSATANDIARNCLAAAEAAKQVEMSATESAYIVMESVNVMNSIAERVQNSSENVAGLGKRSDQIGEIVATIEDIADQTNLLALNAAIEAARAGEQGRGFAVVADEVRALAERTTRATREIGEMIRGIQQETQQAVSLMEEGVNEVERGISESARSSEAISLILGEISDLGSQISQIATAAEEQTATTGEITNNIQQITDIMNDTAKGAIESSSASSDLARQAENLRQIVSHFKLS